jgi:hypothetical protein
VNVALLGVKFFYCKFEVSFVHSYFDLFVADGLRIYVQLIAYPLDVISDGHTVTRTPVRTSRLRLRFLKESHQFVVDMSYVHVILSGSDSQAVRYELQVLPILWLCVELELGLRQMLLLDLFRLHLSNAKPLVDTIRHPQSGVDAC